MRLIGIRPGSSYVEVESDAVNVHMGPAFRARFPVDAVRSVVADDQPVRGWGVHGWRGRWLVNGSSENLVRVELDPPARARMLGFPVRLRQLRVSVVDPDGLIRALTRP